MNWHLHYILECVDINQKGNALVAKRFCEGPFSSESEAILHEKEIREDGFVSFHNVNCCTYEN